MLVLMAFYQYVPSWQIVFLPLFILLSFFTAFGIGLYLTALNVKYRDVRYALPFLLQLWMFATPVIYPSSLMPERWRWVLAVNPLTGIIEGFRASLLGKPVMWGALGYSAAIAILFLLYAAFYFRRTERQFADIV